MRRIILFVAVSLDGYIARSDGGLDWLETNGDYGYDDFIGGVDTLVMGRKTYDAVMELGDWPYADRKCFVMTHSPAPSGNENLVFVSAPILLMMDDIQKQPGKNIWLVGGGELTREFLRHDLIDDFIITVHPVLLGEGIPLFPPGFQTSSLRLVDTVAYETGLVQLSYRRERIAL